MNIALRAVIIFILLIPPISFYVSYYFGSLSKASRDFSFLDGVLATAILSLFVHSIAISLIADEVRFDILLKMSGGEIKDVEHKIPNETFSKAIRQFAYYNCFILFLSIFFGRLQRWVVISRHLNNGRNELSG